jgi:hypothetical protein
MMAKHDIPRLEAKLKELKELCAKLSNDSDVNEMLQIIHRPGYTTVAEFALVSSTVESLVEQSRNVLTQRHALLVGSKEVEISQAAGR